MKDGFRLILLLVAINCVFFLLINYYTIYIQNLESELPILENYLEVLEKINIKLYDAKLK
jgi:hypothetical protein